MKQKSGPEKQPAEDAIRDIRRATRRHFSAEEKIRVVLEGLRGEERASPNSVGARISFARRQFPPAVIRHAVWLYVRFTLSYRDVEDMLAERGLDVSTTRCDDES